MAQDYKEVVESKRKAMLDALLLSIESNPTRWEKGWIAIDTPYNASTQKNYNGLNALFLDAKAQLKGYKDARWVTFNQAKELGASVKTGEKASEVFYWSRYDKATKKPFEEETVKGMTDEERTQYVKENVRAVLKFYQVFNAEQCIHFPENTKRSTTMSDEERAHQNEQIENIIKNSAAPVHHDGRGRAYYVPATDSIHLPLVESFKTAQDYYATALHEIGHSTGHESRLKRDLTGRFGSESYAIEELRAELSSVFLQTELGINLGGAEIANHGAYLNSWLAAVKKDVNVFYRAAADAGKISDYIKDNYMKASKERTQEENQYKQVEQARQAEQFTEQVQRSETESRKHKEKPNEKEPSYTVELYDIHANSSLGEAAKNAIKPYVGKQLSVGVADKLAAKITSQYGKKLDLKSNDGKTYLIDEDYFSLNYTVNKNGKSVYGGFIPSDRPQGIIDNIRNSEKSIVSSPNLYSRQEISKAQFNLQNLVLDLEQARQAEQAAEQAQSRSEKDNGEHKENPNLQTEQGGQIEQSEQSRQVGQVQQVELVLPIESKMQEYGKATMFKMPAEVQFSRFVFLAPTRMMQADERTARLKVASNFEFTLKNDGREVKITADELRTVLDGKEISKSAQRLAPARRNVERLEALRDNVPSEMKEMPNWCVYRTKWNAEKGKKEKFVLSVQDGKWAKINDRTTWSDFESAYKYALENNCEGLAFALDGSGITCIDLDKCIVKNGQVNGSATSQAEGELNDVAKKLVPALSDTYCERSASGNGLHFFLRDDILSKDTFANRAELPGGDEIEVYDTSRFISMTGDMFGKSKQSDKSDKSNKLGKCPMQTMSWIRTALGAKNKIEPSQRSTDYQATELRYQSDSQVLERIRRSKKREQFDLLYNGGDVTGDKHVDDLIMLNTLAFFTDCNQQQMRSIFEGSGRYRPQTKNAAYLTRSIQKACDSLVVRFGQNRTATPAKGKK